MPEIFLLIRDFGCENDFYFAGVDNTCVDLCVCQVALHVLATDGRAMPGTNVSGGKCRLNAEHDLTH